MVREIRVRDVFNTYCYIDLDEETGHGFLIDPGAEPELLLDLIRENGWTMEKILLTHGHFDHTGAVSEISQKLQIPYMIHENGKEYLTDPYRNLSAYCERYVVLRDAEYFRDGDQIRLQANPKHSLQVIHTPGHTTDSVVFFRETDKIAFVGDTIFKGSIGSTRYPGGNMTELKDSILNRIFQLPAETVLFSGHSRRTTVAEEIQRYI